MNSIASNITPLELHVTLSMQTTLANEFEIKGMGVFSGIDVFFRARPADVDTGIVFVKSGQKIEATIQNLDEQPNRTVLSTGDTSIGVVEHILAALKCMGVDNAVIETESPEMPILDASAARFVEAITDAGIIDLDKPRTELIVKTPIAVNNGNMYLTVLPDEHCRLTYYLDHIHPQIGQQADSIVITPQTFKETIGPARTFATRQEAEYLLEKGIVKTSDEDTAIIVGDDGPNKKLHNSREFVHHKILDIVGDISLAYWPVRAHIIGIRSGHHLNHQLAELIDRLVSMVEN